MQDIIPWFSRPIFSLTPYILMWSWLLGPITLVLLDARGLRGKKLSQGPRIAVIIATGLASSVWNWSIEFNGSSRFLNVDHPVFRVSWADALNAIIVFAAVALASGITNPKQPASMLLNIAVVAALVTFIADTFLF